MEPVSSILGEFHGPALLRIQPALGSEFLSQSEVAFACEHGKVRDVYNDLNHDCVSLPLPTNALLI